MSWFFRQILLGLLWVYKKFLSPFFNINSRCRYEPSCSEYMRQAIIYYGPWRGFVKGLARLGRCHPWADHEIYDPPVSDHMTEHSQSSQL